MSHFSAYLKEYANKHVLETEKGFATYSFVEPNTVYLENIYISPLHRDLHNATDLANQVSDIAKEKGCTKMIGSVTPSATNSTASLKVLLSYGMNLLSSQNDMIFFTKDII